MNNLNDLKIFVSSTSEDLGPYRTAARLVILDTGWTPVMMEHFGTSEHFTVDACREKLKTCDLMLLIVAFRRGWIPTSEQGGDDIKSITALELEYAREQKMPVLVFLARDTWPGNLWEREADSRNWIENFRQELNQPAVFFDYEPEIADEAEHMPAFRAKIKEAIVSYRERLIKNTNYDNSIAIGTDYFESAYDGLKEGTGILFIGSGVFGDGPMGTASLIKALGDKSSSGEVCLATAAEYRERYLGSRRRFLDHFRNVLDAQNKETQNLPVYDLISNLKAPRIIIAATFANVLENILISQEKDFVIVSHILRSYDGEYDGRILIQRPHSSPLICLADKLDIRDDELIIYRPHGSPYLHDELDPDLEIDTVVITESDHLKFLGRLENQHTKIPTKFSRLLRRRPMLFIGYTLDVWHYRLVMRVFQSVGTRGPRAVTLAVRKPASKMEEIAWKRLGTDLIPLDPNEFANRVSEAMKKGK